MSGPTHGGEGSSDDAREIAALAELGEQLRAAAARRSELLAADPDAAEAAAGDGQVVELRPAAADPDRSHRGRRGRWVAMAVAAAVVAVVAGSVVGLGLGGDPVPVAAGVDVASSEGSVTVSIDDEADPDEVAAALRAAGVDALVEGQRTGPSRVGRFVGISGSTPEATESSADGTVARFRSGDAVTLFVGVPAEPGEVYDSATDAFAPGEPFEGLDEVLGMPWAQAEPLLAARAQQEGVRLELLGSGAGTVSMVQMISTTEARVLS